MIDVFINPTNGVVYVKVVITFEKVDIPNLWLLPFVNLINTLIGAGKFDEFEMTKYVQRWVSTMDSDASIIDSIEGKKVINFTFSSSCLNEDIDKLCEIMKIVATEAHWDNEKKIEILVNQSILILSKMKNLSMDSFNAIRAGSILNKETAIDEAVNGLIGLNKFHEFLKNKSIKEISEACETLFKQVLTNGQIHGYVSCSEEMKKDAVSAVFDIIQTIKSVPKIDYEPFDYVSEIFNEVKSTKTFINLSVPTGALALKKFCVKVDEVKTSVCLSILSIILTNEAVLDNIREKLGAYSASASFLPRTGVFTIWTYRDSVPQKSYERILQILSEIDKYINDETVERAVVSSLSKRDQPQPPPTKGIDDAIYNVTREYLQKRRDVFLSATADDVKEAAKLITNGEFNVSITTSLNVTKPPEGFVVIDV